MPASVAEGAAAGRFTFPVPGVNEPQTGEEVSYALIMAEEEERRNRYRINWAFYEGLHWSQQMQYREAGQSGPMTVNLVQDTVDINNVLLVGKPPSFAPLDDADPVMEERAEYVNRVWAENNIEVLLEVLTQMAGVTGDAFMYVNLIPPDESEDGEWHIRLEVKPPEYVVIHRPMDMGMNAIDALMHIYPKYSTLGVADMGVPEATEGAYWTPKFWRPIQDSRYGAPVPNPWFPKMPWQHYRNAIQANRPYGRSEIEAAKGLNRYYEEALTDRRDILQYWAHPTTIVYGSTVSAAQKGIANTWSFTDKDVKVENLEMKADMKPTEDHIKTIRSEYDVVTNRPEHMNGKAIAMSNTSSAAIHGLYLPARNRQKKRQAPLGEFLKGVNELIMRGGELLGHIRKVAVPRAYQLNIAWGDVLPHSRAALLDEQKMMMAMGMANPVDCLMEQGYTRKQAIARYKAWVGDRLMQMEMGLIADPRDVEKDASTRTSGPPKGARQAAIAGKSEGEGG